MDPDEALRRIRELVATDMRPWKARGHWDEVEELRELFEALDEWLSHGGFPPADWTMSVGRPWELLPEPLGPPNPAGAELPGWDDRPCPCGKSHTASEHNYDPDRES